MNSKYLIFWLLVLSLVPGISARGQETAGRPEYPWHASINVGMVGNVYENVGSYFRHNKAYDLVTGSLSVSAGYDFTEAFSVRLSLASDKNAGACNSLQSGGGFYPYVFSSLNVFADALYNVSRRRGHFVPKFYLGLGFAHTFNFRKERDWSHDWESVHGELPFVRTSNVVFGFRGGFLGEFLLSQEVVSSWMCAVSFSPTVTTASSPPAPTKSPSPATAASRSMPAALSPLGLRIIFNVETDNCSRTTGR